MKLSQNLLYFLIISYFFVGSMRLVGFDSCWPSSCPAVNLLQMLDDGRLV